MTEHAESIAGRCQFCGEVLKAGRCPIACRSSAKTVAIHNVAFCHDSRCLHCNSDPQLLAEIEAAWARYEARVVLLLPEPESGADEVAVIIDASRFDPEVGDGASLRRAVEHLEQRHDG